MQLPPRTRFLLATFAVTVAILTALRFVFWMVFSHAEATTEASDLLRSFFIGFKFDTRLTVLLLLPLFVLWRFRRLDPLRTPRARRFWPAYQAFVACAVVLFYLADFANYSWLRERFDASRLDCAGNPMISMRVVWESYPVLRVALGLALLGAALYFLFRWILARCLRAKPTLTRRRRIAVSVGTVALMLFGIYGKISWYPLRWSDAYFSTDRFSSDLALNPVLFFFDTLATAEGKRYDREEVTRHYARIAEYLGVEEPDVETLNFSRRIRPMLLGNKTPNIVVIQMESFSSHTTGFLGNPLNPSPNFDAIAKDSYFFPNFYTHRDGTARCVFSVLTGIPDTVTYRTATRNPRLARQYTILNALEGFEKFYFLGGSANWANIRGLLSENVADLRIYEEGDFKAPRIDVWGISDLHLLEEANEVLRAAREPFFAYIQLSANHKPYTIPDDHRGFEKVEVDDATLKKHGFRELGELNSFRFLDHSLGHYMRNAAKEEYFKNTVFFLSGDNGKPTRSPHMPAHEAFGLNLYHTPLLIYAPGLIREGKTIPTPAGQIDILPTAAALAGRGVWNTGLGRNLLEDTGSALRAPRFTLVQTKAGAVPELNLIGGDFILVVKADGTSARLHNAASERPLEDLAAKHPQIVEEMTEFALGLYHTSKYVMYHNDPSAKHRE